MKPKTASRKYATGVDKAEYWKLFRQWAANSQYGYPLSWHKTKDVAVKVADAYYATRRHLLDQ